MHSSCKRSEIHQDPGRHGPEMCVIDPGLAKDLLTLWNTAFADLANADPRRLELHLHRGIGQGNAIIAAAERFPRFSIDVAAEAPICLETSPPTFEVHYTISIGVEGQLASEARKGSEFERYISFLAVLSDGPPVRYLRIK